MPESPGPRPPSRTQGPIGNLLAIPLRLFGMLCGSLLLSIAVECVCLHFLWPEQRWHHAERMLNYELAQLSTGFRESLLMQHPTQAGLHAVEWTYEHLFVRSGFMGYVHELSARSQAQARHSAAIPHLLGTAFVTIEDYAKAAGYTLLTFIVRVLVLCLTLPLFVLAWFVGVVDGLARRDIRRFGAGRESGFVYHRARATLLPLVVLPWVVYLALPISVQPLLILLPSAILLSIAVNLAAGSFKKYL